MPIECVPRNSPCGHSSEKNTLSRLMHRNPCRGPSTPQEAASQLLVPLRMTTITYAFPAPAAAFPARTTSKTLCPTADAHKIYRLEEHTSELQSHSFISYAVFCLKKKTPHHPHNHLPPNHPTHTTHPSNSPT